MLVNLRAGGDYRLVFALTVSIFSASRLPAYTMNTPWTALLALAPQSAITTPPATALIPLPALAVIQLTGPESLKFMQGQATTDFREVEKGRVLRGGICSLKGRLLFSFIAVPQGENVALVLPADQLEAALTHLKKYAVFSKTQLTASPLALLGVSGPDAEAQVHALLGQVPGPEQALQSADGRWALRIGAENRFLVALPAAALQAHWPDIQKALAGESRWWAAEIQAGLATVFAASRDLFQPQELNLHALEAVSYNKGCYTGQEVVARLYFRGKLKQRLYHLRSNAQGALPGSSIHAGSAHVGDVVMSCTHDGLLELLAVVKNTAVRDQALSYGENGPALVEIPLPYALPSDKEE